MELVLANPRGFCAGVERAIQVVELALERFGPPIYVRHGIVHNRTVVESLRDRGAVFVDHPAQAPAGSVLIYSAHGVSPAVRAEAAAHDHHVLDATCPLVTKVHVEAERFARQGHEILLIGHRGHVEVEGTMGHATGRIQLVETVDDAARVHVDDPDRVAVLTQTTLSVDDTRAVLEVLRARFPAIEAPRKSDICYATQNRQNAVKALAAQVDRIVVISAPESSNGMRLVETARQAGVDVVAIETADDLEAAALRGAAAIGLTAGAAVPEYVVASVVARIRAMAEDEVRVRPMPEVDEGMRFQLPIEIREAVA